MYYRYILYRQHADTMEYSNLIKSMFMLKESRHVTSIIGSSGPVVPFVPFRLDRRRTGGGPNDTAWSSSRTISGISCQQRSGKTWPWDAVGTIWDGTWW